MKKYLRFIIMATITLILVLIILFYNPNAKYLGIYKNSFTIKYDFNDDGYKWQYDIDPNMFNIEINNDGSWTFNPLNSGISDIIFYYKNDAGDIKYKIYYKFEIKNNKIYWIEGYGDGLLSYPNPY